MITCNPYLAPHTSPFVLPLVSLIIPCRNEEKTIGRVLRSLLAQDYPAPRIEILLVDGMSADRTRTIIQRFAAQRCAPRIRILDNPRRVTPAAFNIGVSAARGDVIFTLGAHTEYSTNYVSAAIVAMRETGSDAVGSVAETRPGADTPVARAIAAALSCRFGVGNSLMRVGVSARCCSDTASCPGYRRDVFRRIGLFNPRLLRNQDIEFNIRLRRAGGTILIEPAMKSIYHARPTFRALARNAFANGYWVVRAAEISRFPFRLRHLVPLASLALLAALAVATALHPPIWPALVLPLAGYALLTCHSSLPTPRSSLLTRLAVFPTLHLSYALGSAWAALTIPIRRLIAPSPCNPATLPTCDSTLLSHHPSLDARNP